MKHFYKITALHEGKHTIHIVKALNEAEAQTMIPQGHKIVSVVNKGPVEL